MDVEKFLDDVVVNNDYMTIDEKDITFFRNRGEELHTSFTCLSSREDMLEEKEVEKVVETALQDLGDDLTSLRTILIYMQGNISFSSARKFAREVRDRVDNEVQMIFGTATAHDVPVIEITMLAV